MTEKHIPFSGPMVRAILEGCKTQTRRVRRGDEPKYRVGDHLWVRENYAVGVEWDDEKPSEIDPLCGGADIWYMADGPKPAMYGKTRPSIFMPRWASRITLEVTGVRVGRVQDISEEDVLSEGTEQELAERLRDKWYEAFPRPDGKWVKLWGACEMVILGEWSYPENLEDWFLWEAPARTRCLVLVMAMREDK